MEDNTNEVTFITVIKILFRTVWIPTNLKAKREEESRTPPPTPMLLCRSHNLEQKVIQDAPRPKENDFHPGI